MEQAEPQLSSSLGRITISTGAIAQIVSQTAARCYGVVGMGAETSGLAGDVARFLGREHQARGRDRPQAGLQP